ncbi:MAG: (2Fe-2S)-binding protein [Deltaproteobacteria bacterium]|nr:(2Fe-2S)-binding protein [Deltaproteobacteria bacterium]
MKNGTPASCPGCAATGRRVDDSTPGALLRPNAKARLTGGGYRFCRTESCDVVYFDEGQELTFGTADLEVTVFQKSSDPERPVCYCFEHTVQSIYDEVGARGASDVPEDIGEKCRAGLDDCEHNNPQGSCCLGNVRRVVKEALRARGDVGKVHGASRGCCSGSGESQHGS